MTEPMPHLSVDRISLPVADARAAERAAVAMRDELSRLWSTDRRAGHGWRGAVGTVGVDGIDGEAPEALGVRLAAEVRARLVTETGR